MKGFQFRLQRLLRVRELEEQAARERWAAEERAAQDAAKITDQARAQKLAAWQELRRKADRPAERIALEGTLPGLQDRLQRCREQLQGAQQRSETERQRWSSERARVQSLERLKERDSTLFRAAATQRENEVMDEIAGMRDARKASAGMTAEDHRKNQGRGNSQ